MAPFNIAQRLKAFRNPLIPEGSYAGTSPRAEDFLRKIEAQIIAGNDGVATQMIKGALQQKASSYGSFQTQRKVVIRAPNVGVPDLGFKGARQQLFQRFNLIDLYGMAHNNSTLKTATLNLRFEVFRRGLEWEPAFAFRCVTCGVDFSKEEYDEHTGTCPACTAPLAEPDPSQRVQFERLMPSVNLYDQSLISLLKTLEDDLNIVDDAFLFLSSQYQLVQTDNGESVIKRYVKALFRLDPIFVEFDTDDDNRPGMAHHICLAHRENLMDVPKAAGWEYDWKGVCPIDGHSTLPVIYRYVPTRGTYGAQKGGVSTGKDALYLVKGEVIHASKFSPSELYGYSPVLSIYEKVLSLIGMDRYLYDYFFERKMPQGIITTVTDQPEALELQKEEVLAKTLADPHYLPWLAVSSKNGQGKTEFTRFAYSLDELQFLPVQEALSRAVAGLYGVPDLFMGFEQSGGLGSNQTQQMGRMSRGAMSSQEVHNTDILMPLLEAMGVTDWRLTLTSADEQSEDTKWDLSAKKATWAQLMHTIGFGIEYDQENDEFTITGEVKSAAEQDPYGGMGGAGIPNADGGDAYADIGQQLQRKRTP